MRDHWTCRLGLHPMMRLGRLYICRRGCGTTQEGWL